MILRCEFCIIYREFGTSTHLLHIHIDRCELRFASLKVRRQPTTGTTETLEVLRKKQTELQDEERAFRRRQDEAERDMQQQRDQLEQKQVRNSSMMR